VVEPDRAAAIEKALGDAHAGDTVLLAGKGHESYQIVGDEKRPFDDRAVARRILREMGFATSAAGSTSCS
jgi:UDP-N-acetylmuramoyl-L-alanyl-D-glutamate--2,6-diaminopimelate ligase